MEEVWSRILKCWKAVNSSGGGAGGGAGAEEEASEAPTPFTGIADCWATRTAALPPSRSGRKLMTFAGSQGAEVFLRERGDGLNPSSSSQAEAPVVSIQASG